MKISLLSTSQANEWQGVLSYFQDTDIYFLPEYHRAHELNGDGTAYAFVAQEANHVLFYPFLVRRVERVGQTPVSDNWYDIETVYGYSGPLSNTEDPVFLRKAWSEFSEWCSDERIVAEFIRCHPLLSNHRFLNGFSALALDRETIAMDLRCSPETLWERYPPRQRNSVAAANRAGLQCEQRSLAEGLDDFIAVYAATMNRLGARKTYYLSDAYFRTLRDELSGQTRVFIVRDKAGIAAASLLFFHGNRAHYHLSGSRFTRREYGSNNFLLHYAALWAIQQGISWFHLGGGRTPSPDDTLLRFKSALSGIRLPFYTATRIHNKPVYQDLCAQWMKQRNPPTRPPYFLLYRLEEAA